MPTTRRQFLSLAGGITAAGTIPIVTLRPLEATPAMLSAAVRNVTLPGTYTHIGMPQAEHLAANALTRAWIDAYAPGRSAAALDEAHVDTINLIHAADIWQSVKKHWCIEAQRLALQGKDSR